MKKQEVSQQEYQQLAFQTALAKSIISSQFALHNNEVLKHTEYFKSDVKKYGKPFILALIRAEIKEFNKVDNVDTKRVDEIFASIDNLLNTLSRAVFADWEELDKVIKAYAKDRDSIMGITNKIMR